MTTELGVRGGVVIMCCGSNVSSSAAHGRLQGSTWQERTGDLLCRAYRRPQDFAVGDQTCVFKWPYW
jgi:hypothetical protein